DCPGRTHPATSIRDRGGTGHRPSPAGDHEAYLNAWQWPLILTQHGESERVRQRSTGYPELCVARDHGDVAQIRFGAGGVLTGDHTNHGEDRSAGHESGHA